jgi:hypothetical protein
MANSLKRYIAPTEIANAAGRDAANRRMRAEGRTSWNEADYNVACAEYSRVLESLERGQYYTLGHDSKRRSE